MTVGPEEADTVIGRDLLPLGETVAESTSFIGMCVGDITSAVTGGGQQQFSLHECAIRIL